MRILRELNPMQACNPHFSNNLPIAGLAAGFDKHAEAIEPLMRLGFGFVEIGEWVLA